MLTNITDAVLGASFKMLMINRKSYDEIPLRVEYSLSEKGMSAVPILQSICQWSGAYRKEDTEYTMPHCQKCDDNDSGKES
ncbi:winged helix-turn-helix transcriptional regulator [Otoolea muris]|uniref:winged helix-turn-helix transcriptional regulator n=1 Tax=Otoolea muris TaxID=2941515 RepID=UPI00203DB981|nr:winged helix-turn-helix transcriptional regulator [Otoolea muris]